MTKTPNSARSTSSEQEWLRSYVSTANVHIGFALEAYAVLSVGRAQRHLRLARAAVTQAFLHIGCVSQAQSLAEAFHLLAEASERFAHWTPNSLINDTLSRAQAYLAEALNNEGAQA